MAGRPPAAPRRLLVQVQPGLHELLELDDVYYLEATEAGTLVRTRRRRPYLSDERLGVLEARLPSPPFARVHRSFVVNLERARQLRRRDRDWELKLDPPVNAVIPVGRSRGDELLALLGGY